MEDIKSFEKIIRVSKVQSNSISRMIVGAVLIGCFAFLTRIVGNSRMPVQTDELYHLLAGQSWLAHQNFSILDGSYPRGALYTIMSAWTFWLSGSADVNMVRLPSMVAGTLIVPLLFVWLWRISGPIAAWSSSFLFAISPVAVDTSQFGRFYSLHALLVFAAAITVFEFRNIPKFWRPFRLPFIALCLLVAIHLQITAIVAAGSMAAFVVAEFGLHPRVLRLLLDRQNRFVVALLSALLIAILATGTLWALPKLQRTSLWATEDRYNVLYYSQYFRQTIPLLWFLLPFATLVGLERKPRLTAFCFTMLAIPLTVQSIGGMKSPRYVLYALPFLYALWGIAIQVLLPRIGKVSNAVVSNAANAIGIPQSPLRNHMFAGSLVAICSMVAVGGNLGLEQALKEALTGFAGVVRRPESLMAPPLDPPWTSNIQALNAAIGNPEIFVAADDLRSILYLKPMDILINASRISDIEPPEEFVRDPRTGRRVIGRPESVERVINCFSSGTILIPEVRWRSFFAVPQPTADRIEALAVPIVPPVPGFRIFRWAHAVSNPACQSIRDMIKGRHEP